MFPGADEVRDWIEEILVIFQGSRRGEKFTVLDWQMVILRLLETHPEVAWSAARANGKSVFAGALAAAATRPDGPLHQPTGEVLVVASSAEQAAKCFDAAFLLLFGDGQPDRREWSFANNPIRRVLKSRVTGATLKVISSDPRRAHGAQPHLIICDEPAQWPPNTARKMFAALRTARGKLSDSRLLILGTRSDDPGHFFSRQLEGPGAICFSGDPEADPLDERQWALANPSLDHLPDLRAAIAHEAAEARRDSFQRAHFLSLRINAGTSDTRIEFVVEAPHWLACEVDEVPMVGTPYFGFDAGLGASMTACSSFWPESGGLRSLACFPTNPSLRARGVEDNVSDLYVNMAARGELVTLGGGVSDLSAFLDLCCAKWGKPAGIAADHVRGRELVQAMEDIGLRCPVSWRKGLKHWSEDLRAFRKVILEQELAVERSLLLTQGLKEARVHVTAEGARLARKAQSGRRERARDDAIVSSLLAVGLGKRGHRKPQRRRGRVLVG